MGLIRRKMKNRFNESSSYSSGRQNQKKNNSDTLHSRRVLRLSRHDKKRVFSCLASLRSSGSLLLYLPFTLLPFIFPFRNSSPIPIPFVSVLMTSSLLLLHSSFPFIPFPSPFPLPFLPLLPRKLGSSSASIPEECGCRYKEGSIMQVTCAPLRLRQLRRSQAGLALALCSTPRSKKGPHSRIPVGYI